MDEKTYKDYMNKTYDEILELPLSQRGNLRCVIELEDGTLCYTNGDPVWQPSTHNDCDCPECKKSTEIKLRR